MVDMARCRQPCESKLVCVVFTVEAVWFAGDQCGRLAGKHHLQTLGSQQQTDYLLLAGQCALTVVNPLLAFVLMTNSRFLSLNWYVNDNITLRNVAAALVV